MKNRSIEVILIITALLLSAGCATKKERMKNNHSVKKTGKTSRTSRSYDDPLFNTIFQKRSDRPKYMRDVKLSEKERKLLDNSFGSPGEWRSDPDLENMRRDMRSGESERSDWVFGTKNGKLF